jgi:rubrerythrin
MICETCEGEGYLRGKDELNPGALVMLPCLECNSSGFVADPAEPPSFVCPLCDARSYNPNDIAQRYCGRCHAFVDDPRHRLDV